MRLHLFVALRILHTGGPPLDFVGLVAGYQFVQRERSITSKRASSSKTKKKTKSKKRTFLDQVLETRVEVAQDAGGGKEMDDGAGVESLKGVRRLKVKAKRNRRRRNRCRCRLSRRKCRPRANPWSRSPSLLLVLRMYCRRERQVSGQRKTAEGEGGRCRSGLPRQEGHNNNHWPTPRCRKI
eukprot:g4308.t1